MKPIFSKKEVHRITRGHVSPFYVYAKSKARSSISWVIGMMVFAVLCAAYIVAQDRDEHEMQREDAYKKVDVRISACLLSCTRCLIESLVRK
jgi:hypothetical protein